MDAERAHLGRVLGVTTMVLLVASFSYLAVSTLYGCLRAARVVHAPPGNDDDTAPAETRDDTKRALDGIPVRVVVLQSPRDADAGGRKQDAEADADDECAVCLAEFVPGDEVRVLPACRHGFHSECVDRWLLTRAPTCPVCRAPVAAPVEESGTKQACATGHGHHVGIGGDEYRSNGAITVSLVE
ncbi:E3 ubiquitin-protein ligase Os03g0188200-like [Lolium rigidum]|uniref:E3 ubiquitin-protein ligase Os03g0188200-like n=1 Tax=Lolium rigidum TaxID=89674 RepID=UPI001F5E006C|nr:E3 ubiquitin-protein ligase Os03g0188200-like [Lolium rigidum]